MEEDLYSPVLLRLATEVAEPKHVENPDFVNEAYSPVCGSRVTVELKFNPDTKEVIEFGYEAEACALTRTVLAIMKNTIIGQTIGQIQEAGNRLQKLLDEDMWVLEENWGAWNNLKIMETAQDYTMRHHSIMLPFMAVNSAS